MKWINKAESYQSLFHRIFSKYFESLLKSYPSFEIFKKFHWLRLFIVKVQVYRELLTCFQHRYRSEIFCKITKKASYSRIILGKAAVLKLVTWWEQYFLVFFQGIFVKFFRITIYQNTWERMRPYLKDYNFDKGSFIWKVRKICKKTNISYPLIRTRTCAYRGMKC